VPTPMSRYPLTLHDALPICVLRAGAGPRRPADGDAARDLLRRRRRPGRGVRVVVRQGRWGSIEEIPRPCIVPFRTVAPRPLQTGDRKSTRLNSSHVKISYAV